MVKHVLQLQECESRRVKRMRELFCLEFSDGACWNQAVGFHSLAFDLFKLGGWRCGPGCDHSLPSGHNRAPLISRLAEKCATLRGGTMELVHRRPSASAQCLPVGCRLTILYPVIRVRCMTLEVWCMAQVTRSSVVPARQPIIGEVRTAYAKSGPRACEFQLRSRLLQPSAPRPCKPKATGPTTGRIVGRRTEGSSPHLVRLVA